MYLHPCLLLVPVYDLLLAAQPHAKANDRDVMLPMDLPIPKGLQECIHDFEDLNEEIELLGILDQLTKFPLLDLEYGDDLEKELPKIAGGLSVALARSFKILDPKVKNPQSEHWERAFKVFDLIWVMTQGGPGRSSETLAVTMYREGFILFNEGYSAAIAVIISLAALLFSYFYLRSVLDQETQI